jgi:queuine/archaeosine tRNA-ribosyltransferase
MREKVEMIRRDIDRICPIHLFVIGGTTDTGHNIKNAIDTFDCVSRLLEPDMEVPSVHDFSVDEKN